MSKQLLFNADAGVNLKLVASSASSGNFQNALYGIAADVIAYINKLPKAERSQCVLLYGNNPYRYDDYVQTGVNFVRTTTTNTGASISRMAVSTTKANCTYYRMIMSPTGTEFQNYSSNSITTQIEFYAP